ncbi:MAG TPA: hypothetical protein PKD64_14895 [Pirellulaceae bacterium]|nr:hypothetical protein [Pirellulaceae bacterium]HMO93470.1 hypothetical protein [Pirellulaceae bacterium]HMP69215.1 hypothetical protein [Pirellulaceae bacterium]
MSKATRQSKLAQFYRDYLDSEKSADFVAGVSQHYTLETLSKLAANGDRIGRRASVLAIGFLGDYRFNSVLGEALRDGDRAVRLLADHGIRQLWFRVPDPYISSSLRRLARCNQQLKYDESLNLANRIIQAAPMTAEAWNQRAITSFAQGDYWHAVCDCRETLELNPYHFVAAMGMANCHMQMKDGQSALASFRKALSINPDLDRVRMQVASLERIFE